MALADSVRASSIACLSLAIVQALTMLSYVRDLILRLAQLVVGVHHIQQVLVMRYPVCKLIRPNELVSQGKAIDE